MDWGILSTILLCALALLLVSAGVEDVRKREIANWKNAAIALLAPVWWFATGLSLWPGVAVQASLALVVFVIFIGAFALGMMGGGDVKLIGALALWFPFQPLLWMLLVMSLLGGALSLLLLGERWWQKKKTEIEVPYGVAIAIAALFAMHEPILNRFS